MPLTASDSLQLVIRFKYVIYHILLDESAGPAVFSKCLVGFIRFPLGGFYLSTSLSSKVLKLLNSNTRDPYLIWDNATRAELLEFVEYHRTSNTNTSELFGAEFKMSLYVNELIVGDIFVRIYNEQPNFVLYEPKKVCMDLLDFLDDKSHILLGDSKEEKALNGEAVLIDWETVSEPSHDVMNEVSMCLEALANLLTTNPGGLLYILSILCESQAAPEDRLAAAELLAKLQANKLTGPRWSRFITRYLPPIFTDALRDSPQAAISMFDSKSENPELIWNEATRSNVKMIVKNGCNQLYAAQQVDPNAKWNSGSVNDACAYADVMAGELVVGGVFLRLFIANPSWQVRHPKQFATELMERVLDLMIRPTAELETVTSAFVALISNHPSTADQLPAQGYLPQFCTAMSSSDANTSRCAILILSHLTENAYCADSLAKLDCIGGILNSMKNQPMLVRESAHALKFLLKRSCTELAGQMISSGMIEHLLKLLADPMPDYDQGFEGVENAAAAKAEIVDALKSVCLDLQYGEKITEILNKSPIWAQYRDQRHDLFLPAQRTQAIAGASSGIAGYLTEGMFTPPSRSFAPPPIISDK
uniref:Uncharacterized protein n=1 Tax=Ascaris lumbricoides TaxID=6252 RepID=A0A9J2PM00_ASCLU